MARNVEIKAKISDLAKIQSLAHQLSDQPPTILRQKDIFFHVSHGRLKLRLENDQPGQLIHYQRSDAAEARLSEYVIYRTDETACLEGVLCGALGIKCVVEKERQLFLTGRTRIHIDQVVNLGNFVEIEVVLRDDEQQSAGETELHAIMSRLHIERDKIVAVAYADLLESQRPSLTPSSVDGQLGRRQVTSP